MKPLKALLVFLLCSASVLGQKNFSLSGTLIDNVTKEPVDFASVSLLNAKDSTFVTGAISDSKGIFNLQGISKGRYLVNITFIGYKTVYHPVRISGDNLTTNIGKISLVTNDILLAGGELKAPTLSVTGEKAAAIFKDIYVEKLFLATGGFSLTAGLTYPGISDLPVKEAMINSAQTIYLLADSSKLEKVYFASLSYQKKINYLFTDDKVEESYIKSLNELGIEVIIC